MREKAHATNFWRHVKRGSSGECWVWGGFADRNGYGIVTRRFGGKIRTLKAHRIAFELTHGKIPEGLHVCHHCDNPPCVNPAHLFAGTAADNLRDMRAKGRAAKPSGPERCPRGHEYDERNTRWYKGTQRVCRACDRERGRYGVDR